MNRLEVCIRDWSWRHQLNDITEKCLPYYSKADLFFFFFCCFALMRWMQPYREGKKGRGLLRSLSLWAATHARIKIKSCVQIWSSYINATSDLLIWFSELKLTFNKFSKKVPSITLRSLSLCTVSFISSYISKIWQTSQRISDYKLSCDELLRYFDSRITMVKYVYSQNLGATFYRTKKE